jgi:hypothetical protein
MKYVTIIIYNTYKCSILNIELVQRLKYLISRGVEQPGSSLGS